MHLFAPQPGQFVLDIGAHDGSYAEKFAREVGPSGLVWAVEPHPDSAEAARHRLKGYPQVRVIEAAVADVVGSRTLMADVGDLRRSSLWPANLIGSLEAVDVETLTIDALCCGRGIHAKIPDWVKIDAQGAEALILAGAPILLDANETRWCLELWPVGLTNAGSGYADVLLVFKARGYTARKVGKVQHVWDWDELREALAREQGHSSADVIFFPPGVDA